MNSQTPAQDTGPLLSAHRPAIETAMAQHLASGPAPTEADQHAARDLVGLLIAALSCAGSPRADPLAIPRPYYALFGDGLAPVLRDVLASDADAPLLARCIDGFWGAIRDREQAV